MKLSLQEALLFCFICASTTVSSFLFHSFARFQRVLKPPNTCNLLQPKNAEQKQDLGYELQKKICDFFKLDVSEKQNLPEFVFNNLNSMNSVNIATILSKSFKTKYFDVAQKRMLLEALEKRQESLNGRTTVSLMHTLSDYDENDPLLQKLIKIIAVKVREISK